LDLNEISEYIALDNPAAARRLTQKIYSRVKQLRRHPFSGPVIPEIENFRYRQLIEAPCRIFYEVRDETVMVLHIIRSERLLRPEKLDLPE